MTVTGNVLELDLDPKIHTAEILLTMPLYVWGSVFAGWTTPDMLLHYASQADLDEEVYIWENTSHWDDEPLMDGEGVFAFWTDSILHY